MLLLVWVMVQGEAGLLDSGKEHAKV